MFALFCNFPTYSLQCVIEIGSLQPLGCALELHSMNCGLCRPLLIDVYNEYHWSCFLCTGVRISLGWISTSWITAMRLGVFLILINIAILPPRKLWPIYTSNLQFIKCICSLFPCRQPSHMSLHLSVRLGFFYLTFCHLSLFFSELLLPIFCLFLTWIVWLFLFSYNWS